MDAKWINSGGSNDNENNPRPRRKTDHEIPLCSFVHRCPDWLVRFRTNSASCDSNNRSTGNIYNGCPSANCHHDPAVRPTRSWPRRATH